MLILSLDTAGPVASAALLEDGRLLKCEKRDAMLDHSRTLLPLCRQLLADAGRSFADVDLYTAMAGPGSFTGIRIGMAAVKGFALAMDRPCAQVTTMEAGAWGTPERGKLCVTLKSRGQEVYYGLFDRSEAGAEALSPLGCAQLPELEQQYPDVTFVRAEEAADAAAAALCAWHKWQKGETVSCHDMNPVYLKKTQAERMREEKMK